MRLRSHFFRLQQGFIRRVMVLFRGWLCKNVFVEFTLKMSDNRDVKTAEKCFLFHITISAPFNSKLENAC